MYKNIISASMDLENHTELYYFFIIILKIYLPISNPPKEQ